MFTFIGIPAGFSPPEIATGFEPVAGKLLLSCCQPASAGFGLCLQALGGSGLKPARKDWFVGLQATSLKLVADSSGLKPARFAARWITCPAKAATTLP